MKNAYFIGICGSGMLPLAMLADAHGYSVSGSDPGAGSFHPGTSSVRAFADSDPDRLSMADNVVYSSAIPENHPELVEAKRLESAGKLKIWHRMDFLTLIAAEYPIRIGVSGTHGKTSTTSIIGWVLLQAGLNPSIFAGGRPLYLESGMRKGKDIIVFETDESDGSFLRSNANYRLCLNVDRDHLDHYGSFEALQKAFQKFANESEKTVLNALDLHLDLGNSSRFVYFAAGERSLRRPLYAGEFQGDGDSLNVRYFSDAELEIGQLNLSLPGRHFASNALGVLALLQSLPQPISHDVILDAFQSFPGVERRMERIDHGKGPISYDDYGHHPSEITAVLRALRIRHPAAPITLIFQPHRFTRTRDHAQAFADLMNLADRSLILPLYTAGEPPIEGVDSDLIARLSMGRARVVQPEEIPGIVNGTPRDSVILFSGAGTISRIARSAFHT